VQRSIGCLAGRQQCAHSKEAHRMRRLLVPFALAATVSLATPAAAQQRIESLGLTVTTGVGLYTDYLFRGISQTQTNPAIQGTLDIEHDIGVYIGGFASNVDFGTGYDANIELDGVFGYRFSLFGAKFDIGGIYYAYPGAGEGPFNYNFFEAAAKASYEIGPVTVKLGANYSPDFQFESGTGWYVEGGLDIKLPFDFVLSGRYGYQWVQNNPRYGLPDWANWSVSIAREFWGFLVSVGYYDTNISKNECPIGVGGSNVCSARALASVTRTF
jgi:uncharacterized protein (TIGR02001 family)